MMGFKRKKYLIDKGFQLKMSLKAVLFSLLTIFVLGLILLFFANKSSKYTQSIVKNQEQMIEMFLTTPALQNAENPVIKLGEDTFKNNISMLVEIKENSELVLYLIVGMIFIQSLIIFTIFIMQTHRISGPVFVMMRYLKEIQNGNFPKTRPLRKKDELKELYTEMQKAVDYLAKKNN